MSVVMEEIVQAVEDLFFEMGDMAKLVVRRYSSSMTSGDVEDGAQDRMPTGPPKIVTGIIGDRFADREAGRTPVFVKAASLGSLGTHFANSEGEFTVQEPGDEEFPVVGGWKAMGPEPGNPVLFKGTIVTGGRAPS